MHGVRSTALLSHGERAARLMSDSELGAWGEGLKPLELNLPSPASAKFALLTKPARPLPMGKAEPLIAIGCAAAGVSENWDAYNLDALPGMSGTKRTSPRFVSSQPVSVFFMRINCCTLRRGPTGATRMPPGFS